MLVTELLLVALDEPLEPILHVVALLEHSVGGALEVHPVFKQLHHLTHVLFQVDVVPVVKFLADGLQVDGRVVDLVGVLQKLGAEGVIWKHEDDVVSVVVDNSKAVPCSVHPFGESLLVVLAVNVLFALQHLHVHSVDIVQHVHPTPFVQEVVVAVQKLGKQPRLRTV